MPLILGTNSIKDTGFNVANSLRFDDGSSDYLNRTPASAGNRQTCTVSAWVKRSNIVNANIIGCWSANNDNDNINITLRNNGELRVVAYTQNWRISNRLFRDVSAWYHIVVAFDTTQSTANDRIKVYVNGTQETSFSTTNNPSQNANIGFNQASTTRIGTQANALSNYFDGYMTEVCFIDGTALDPTSFGEFDEDTNIWKPIDVSGLTFGTNGFYLDFENSGSLGADVSGNGNNFTVNNLTSIDQTTDTCTNNFATWNPLDKNSTVTLSEGNTKLSATSTEQCRATLGVSSGKWYWEYKIDYTPTLSKPYAIGVCTNTGFSAQKDSPDWRTTEPFNSTWNVDTNDNNIDTYVDGTRVSRVASNLSYPDNGDIINVALDLDNGKIFWGKNGTWIEDGSGNTGNPSTGANPVYSFTLNDYFYFPAIVKRGSSSVDSILLNTGNPPFTISSGNADADGHGNFEYAVPSGYFALCSKNLAEYG